MFQWLNFSANGVYKEYEERVPTLWNERKTLKKFNSSPLYG